jgi:GNAT superfamily N-acetyltransferase
MAAMGRKFYEASGYVDITEYSEESFITSLVNAPDSVFLVVEKDGLVGMAGALVYPFYFNLKHRTAQEMFWWVDPEHRGVGGELFDALLREVKKLGAESLTMIALERFSWVGSYYEKRGFRPTERSFIKRI